MSQAKHASHNAVFSLIWHVTTQLKMERRFLASFPKKSLEARLTWIISDRYSSWNAENCDADFVKNLIMIRVT